MPKRYYIYNALLLLLASLMFTFFKYSGFFVTIIMRQDIIYYTIILPTYIFLGTIGIFYQLFKIDWNDKRTLFYKVGAILNTMYIICLLIFSTRIYLTSSLGLELLLLILGMPLIIFPYVNSIFVNIYKKN